MSRAAKISSAIGGAVLVIVLVVALAIAVIDRGEDAAGSDSGSPSKQQLPGGGAPPGGADRKAFQAFQDCLEEQGVELPDPDSQGGEPPPEIEIDPGDPELRETLSACQKELPEGVGAP